MLNLEYLSVKSSKGRILCKFKRLPLSLQAAFCRTASSVGAFVYLANLKNSSKEDEKIITSL